MSTKSREKKKIVRTALSAIHQGFYAEAKMFITDIFAIENKPAPDFSKMSGDKILHLYGDTQRNLLDKLMRHRHKPIEPDTLKKIFKVNGLPKSIIIILQSFPKN